MTIGFEPMFAILIHGHFFNQMVVQARLIEECLHQRLWDARQKTPECWQNHLHTLLTPATLTVFRQHETIGAQNLPLGNVRGKTMHEFLFLERKAECIEEVFPGNHLLFLFHENCRRSKLPNMVSL
jgi:hypothetical protein